MKINIKDSVHIRFKELKNGKKSIYLDIYEGGKRRYDFLKLYIIPEVTSKDAVANKKTLEVAQAIKARRVVEMQRHNDDFFDQKTFQNESFIEYLREELERYATKRSREYYCSLRSAIGHIIAYAGENVTFKKLTPKFLLGYISYLDNVVGRFGKPLSNASKYTYFNVIVITLNRAVKMGYISKNPAHSILPEDKPKLRQGKREFLTIDEVKLLIKTPCQNEIIKQAFLFSCFSGLRLSDIKSLRWSDISEVGNGRKIIRITMQKTKELIEIPLSANALAYLPDKNDGDVIFPLPMTWVVEKYIDMWVKQAGIKKHITYHCSRHTHATLLLTFGADIYTVSKLLGHKRIQTTEIYAKIVDEKKIAAVDMIPNL